MAPKLGGLNRFHAFPRPEEHLTQRTVTGAVVTLLGVVTIIILFIHELRFFLTTYTVHEMAVDKADRKTDLDILLNITFPSMPCDVLSLDALDMSGNHEVDIGTTIYKVRLDKYGRSLGKKVVKDLVEGLHKHSHANHTNPAEELLDFFQDVTGGVHVSEILAAYKHEEGCRVHGDLSVHRVAGNFHVSVHGLNFFILQRIFTSPMDLNVSHVIHSLSFGKKFPGHINPLDSFSRILGPKECGTFKYFIKIVPTDFIYLNGSVIKTNQFSVTEYFMACSPEDPNMPGVFFMYDFSPIAVTITEKRRNFLHFVTRLCAVLGGAFALTGMLDRWIYLLVQKLTMPQPSPSRRSFKR